MDSIFEDDEYGEARKRKLERWLNTNPSLENTKSIADFISKECFQFRKSNPKSCLTENYKSESWSNLISLYNEGSDFEDLDDNNKIHALLKLLLFSITVSNNSNNITEVSKLKEIISKIETLYEVSRV